MNARLKRPPAPAKRFVDIEHALRWAYRDELPKRQMGGRYDDRRFNGGSIADAADVIALCGNARDDDDRGREPGFPAAMGDPHPDSIVIESAVKHLVDWTGCRFDDAGMAAMIDGIPIAVDVVAIAIEAVSAMMGTITLNARIGGRPKWRMERPTPKWVGGDNGKPRVLLDETFVETWDARRSCIRYVAASELKERDPGAITYIGAISAPATRGGTYREGAYCPLRWLPDPAHLLTERAEYSAWHAALEILADDLTGQLAAIACLPPAAALFPWINGDGAMHGHPPELFSGLREPVHRVVTREQAAAKRRSAQRRRLDIDAPKPKPQNANRRRIAL
jgi:hypothetical protein